MRRWSSLLACSLVACGPVVLPEDGDGSSSEGSATGASSTTSSGTSVTTTAGTLLPTSTTIADDGTDDVDDGIFWDCGAAPPGHLPRCIGPAPDMGGGSGSVCDPQPVIVDSWISVDGGDLPADAVLDPYVYACTIPSWSDAGGLVTFQLACADGPHTLEIGTSVGIAFGTSGDFLLSVIHSQSTFGDQDQLVTLRTADGELVLAGATTPWAPDDPAVPPDFFDPLDVTLLPGVCEVDPVMEGGTFIEPCYAVERQALRFSDGVATLDVYDHGVDELSPWVVLVEHAEVHHDVTCTDTPDTWYSWVVAPPVLR